MNYYVFKATIWDEEEFFEHGIVKASCYGDAVRIVEETYDVSLVTVEVTMIDAGEILFIGSDAYERLKRGEEMI